MMAVFFDSATSADATIEAMQEMRKVAGEQAFISGMSAMVTDMKELCEQEEPIYVGIAVLLSCVVLAIFMDSILLPVLFMASIGMAILLNMGTNFFFGEISYITKALSAVLQLGVTMDYSIFLWHSYKEAKRDHGGRKPRGGDGQGGCQYHHLGRGLFHHHRGRLYRPVLYDLHARP